MIGCQRGEGRDRVTESQVERNGLEVVWQTARLTCTHASTYCSSICSDSQTGQTAYRNQRAVMSGLIRATAGLGITALSLTEQLQFVIIALTPIISGKHSSSSLATDKGLVLPKSFFCYQPLMLVMIQLQAAHSGSPLDCWIAQPVSE